MREDRIFTTKDGEGNDWVLKFKRPSQKVLSKAELVYRTAFSKAFRDGILTNAEVEKFLRERGIWDDTSDEKANQIRSEISELEEKLSDSSLSNEQGKTICLQLVEKRNQLTVHNSVYTQISENTCEAIANEARNRFFCVECIYDNKTDLRVYKDEDDFSNRMDEQVALDAYRETVIASLEVLMGRDLPSDITSEYAENKWLRERKLLENEEEPKSVKKKTRKKRAKKTVK